MKMLLLLVLPCLFILTLGQVIYPPIPMMDTDPGLVYNPDGDVFTGEVRLEAFLELNCPDSVAAWPVLKEVKDIYRERLELVVHQFPLPYHRNGFLCTQKSLTYICEYLAIIFNIKEAMGIKPNVLKVEKLVMGMALILQERPDEVFDYMEGVLDRYVRFSTGLTRRQSELDVIENLADVAVNVTTIDRDFFADNINNYIGDVVRVWKYGCRRGAAGTPWFAVNNIDLTVNPSERLSVEDWREFLDPMFEELTAKSQETGSRS